MDALSVSARLAALLFREIDQGGSILVENKAAPGHGDHPQRFGRLWRLMAMQTGTAPAKQRASAVQMYLQPVGEKDKLQLAKWLLLGIGILFALGAIAALFLSDDGKDLFDTFTTILPPIATLIIGYYFSKN